MLAMRLVALVEIYDALQAGVGDTVKWITGREAALSLPDTFAPVDCATVGIVDEYWADEKAGGVES